MNVETFDAYQEGVARTAIYPEHGSGSVMALSYLGLGLGEVGEIQGKIKKIMRDEGSWVTPEKREELLFEMGDALWYLTRLADELGASLGLVAALNLGKLEGRAERGTLQGSGSDR